MNLARQSSVFPVLWQAIFVMIRLQRGCWATSRRRSSRRALQVCVSSIVFYVVSRQVCQLSSLFPILRDAEQHFKSCRGRLHLN